MFLFLKLCFGINSISKLNPLIKKLGDGNIINKIIKSVNYQKHGVPRKISEPTMNESYNCEYRQYIMLSSEGFVRILTHTLIWVILVDKQATF